MRMFSKFRDDEEGGGMVEFAIVGALLTMILLGIFEFGIAAWAKNNVAADAREGARWAIVHGSRSGTVADSAAVANYVKSRSMLGNGIRVYTVWPGGTAADKDPDSVVWVSVANTVPRRGPFIPAHRDSATSKMRILF
jgi:Flp pilus assembly protein TadG